MVRLAILLATAAAILTGCRLPSNALDGPIAVPLRIDAQPDSIDVDAPSWFALVTAVYVCSSEPPALPEPGPDRDGWTPGPTCHDFGRVAAVDGLHVVLSLTEMAAAERLAFDAVGDRYLLLVKLEGDRATTAIHSEFSAPARSAT